MSTTFLRVFQHLLPRGRAWNIVAAKNLRRLFSGLAAEAQSVRDQYDLTWLDIFPTTTRELAEWEAQYGLEANGTDSERRAALASEWAATGGQSPSYIQGVLQTAGFPVYVHDWWSSGPGPYVARDPRSYTTQPLTGTVQCKPAASAPACKATDANPHRCNSFLANETSYLVNIDLTNNAPPAVPADSQLWPYFLYIGGQSFLNVVTLPSQRRREFERLVLKLKPAHTWVVTAVTYSPSTFDDTFGPEFL